jgi:hypothetical protein
MPGIFRGGAYDVGQEVETAIRDNFKQVPVGSKIRNSNRSISPSERSLERNQHGAAGEALNNDPAYVRRLKKANYGKWFL